MGAHDFQTIVMTTDGEDAAISAVIGWCKTHTDVHDQRSTCEDFVSDMEHVAEMTRQARKHDLAMAGYAEAAYVSEWRPY